MKYPLLLLFILTADFPPLAPVRQGTIYYERKTDMKRIAPNDEMRAMVPHYQTGEYVLFFKDSSCFYSAVPKDEAPDPFDNNPGGGIVMRFSGPGDEGLFFRNFATGQLLEERMLAGKKYLISDSIRPFPWKLSADTQSILGHVCNKATMTSRRGQLIVGWYAQDIPVPIGPDSYGGLPGAILEIDVDSGATTITATRILPGADEKAMKLPTGKFNVITRAEFDRKMDQIFGPADSLGRRMIRN